MSLSIGSGYRTHILFSYSPEENHQLTQEWLAELQLLGLDEYRRRNRELALRLLKLVRSVCNIADQPGFETTTLRELHQLDDERIATDEEPLRVDIGCEHLGNVYSMYPFTLYGVRIYQSIFAVMYRSLTEEEKTLVTLGQVKGDLEDTIARQQEISRYLESFGIQDGKIF